jgi:hypothetical protein
MKTRISRKTMLRKAGGMPTPTPAATGTNALNVRNLDI